MFRNPRRGVGVSELFVIGSTYLAIAFHWTGFQAASAVPAFWNVVPIDCISAHTCRHGITSKRE
jgi:hypothetical protein